MKTDPTIIVALIMFAGTVITQIFVYKGNRKNAEESKKATIEIFDYRIGELEKKVTKHNNFMERLCRVEERSKSNTHRLNRIDGLADNSERSDCSESKLESAV